MARSQHARIDAAAEVTGAEFGQAYVPAPKPSNERVRLQALRRYGVVDTPPEVAFEDLAKLAALICETPVASVGFIEHERQWFKAKVGFDVCETTRADAICSHTILQDDLLVVPDTTEDSRFANHPIVVGGPQIRFYAGAPLVTPSGHRIGALAVTDMVRRNLSDAQLEALRALSRQVVDQLELRLALAQSREEALTDALTGLGNRRSLVLDLDEALAEATPSSPLTLMFLDLDGFKLYNDNYGHAAGDALLSRLAAKLSEAVVEHGAAYRMGGDEFCVLLRGRAGQSRRLANAVSRALSERGQGFAVTSSRGVVVLPLEATDAGEALQLADERMYRQKHGRPGSARAQTAEVVSRILSERTPELHQHVMGVTELARKLGTRLKLNADELDELTYAAELHDIGKLALPEAILTKPGALTEDEWLFVRRHTLIGERMLSAAAALESVAKIVRSSHERWDGTGYPDGLRGEEIPLASRITFVCDSFHAMISHRPYRQSMGVPAALGELRRCAGTQFDPTLVAIFCEVLDT